MNQSVLFVAASAYPLGGVATWLDYLMPGLEQRGWQVDLCLLAGRYHDADSYRNKHPWHNLEVLLNRAGTASGRQKVLANMLERRAPGIVVSVNVPDVFYAVSLLRSSHRGNCRAVMSLHAIQQDFYDDARRFGSLIDAAVATNRLACRLLETAGGVSSDRIYYAPYGVAPFPSRPIGSPGPLKLLYAGRLDTQQKRVLDIPPLLDKLQNSGFDFSLTVAGAGHERQRLQAMCADYKVDQRVHFAGALNHDQLLQSMPEYDVLLVTSNWETGPIVIFEAMMRDVAVVSSQYVGAGLEGALRDGVNCFLFPVGDMDTAQIKILRLSDPGVRNGLIKQARRLVESRYSRTVSVEHWHRVFVEVLENEPLDSAGIMPPPSSGRLDRLFGSAADTVRGKLRLPAAAFTAGDEWPHSYGTNQTGEDFLDLSRKLDNDELERQPENL